MEDCTVEESRKTSSERAVVSRRKFMAGTAAAAAAFTLVPRRVLGGPGYQAPSDTLNIACIGIGGMGQTNLRALESQNIVALCDVDDVLAAPVYNKYPAAARYHDYRKMLEKQKDIDGVVIATPDHMHAVQALASMELGKHVYCQKPLTRLVSEARALRLAAAKYGVATQMGNQGHSSEDYRLVCEYIWSGAIGRVHEVIGWTDRAVWPQGIDRPADKPKLPKTLKWDLFLGVAPERPYHPVYHPFSWRGWWDFGTGALGDMGCHQLDSAFAALHLGYPSWVEASISTFVKPDKFWEKVDNKETFPQAAIVAFQFPERKGLPPVKLTWYDGGLKPPRPDAFEPNRRMGSNGVLFIGDKGVLMVSDGGPRLVPETAMQAFPKPPKTLKRIETSHELNWVEGCKKGENPGSHFGHAGPLTEMVLLGNLAVRFPYQKLEWDGEAMQITNHAEANDYVRPHYREGWG
ncbi:Gfo/Idh/MocA family oxidoreductase [bacterium]|nr:Gfo/Idh/MocA family oxidoreductase [bacterium]